MTIRVLNEEVIDTWTFRYGSDLIDNSEPVPLFNTENNWGAAWVRDLLNVTGKSMSATELSTVLLFPVLKLRKWTTVFRNFYRSPSNEKKNKLKAKEYSFGVVVWKYIFSRWLLQFLLYVRHYFSALQELYILILTTTLWIQYFYFPYFTC